MVEIRRREPICDEFHEEWKGRGLRGANVAVFRGCSLRENGVVLGATRRYGERVLVVQEEFLEGVVFLALGDVVGAARRVFDALMPNGATSGDLRDGKPGILRHGRETHEEGAFRFGEEAFLRLGGG